MGNAIGTFIKELVLMDVKKRLVFLSSFVLVFWALELFLEGVLADLIGKENMEYDDFDDEDEDIG